MLQATKRLWSHVRYAAQQKKAEVQQTQIAHARRNNVQAAQEKRLQDALADMLCVAPCDELASPRARPRKRTLWSLSSPARSSVWLLSR